MEITIHSKGVQQGPFSEEQVKQLLLSGGLSDSDLGWSPGMEEWKPLSAFPELKNDSVPPPMSAQDTTALEKTEPLAIWSLVLGIISIVGCAFGGILAGIPAVICGHIGRSKIRMNPALRGAGMALAGLICGYLAVAVFPVAILSAVAIPAIVQAKEKAKATQMLSSMKQIYLVIQQAQLDGMPTGNPKLGFPADAKIKTKAELKQMLIAEKYVTAEDLDRMGFDKISVGNVSEADPSDTILLKATVPGGKSLIIFRKGGDGAIYRPGQKPLGSDPPRSPAFLE
ncbi:MAG: DUF4190 domain-containing protein [Verrucomicrobiae bacterium]